MELDPPQPLYLYLGYIHHQRAITLNQQSLNLIVYDMEDFLRSSVKLYRKLFPNAPPFRRVSTPCYPENHHYADAARVFRDGGELAADRREGGGDLAAHALETLDERVRGVGTRAGRSIQMQPG